MAALHTITNVAFNSPVAPENPGIPPTAVVSRPPGIVPVIWKIEPIPESPCYRISAPRGQTIDHHGAVCLYNEHEKWKLIDHGSNVYSIVKCHDRQCGWLLENKEQRTPVQCTLLPPGPPNNARWRIDPPPPPPALQD